MTDNISLFPRYLSIFLKTVEKLSIFLEGIQPMSYLPLVRTGSRWQAIVVENPLGHDGKCSIGNTCVKKDLPQFAKLA